VKLIFVSAVVDMDEARKNNSERIKYNEVAFQQVVEIAENMWSKKFYWLSDRHIVTKLYHFSMLSLKHQLHSNQTGFVSKEQKAITIDFLLDRLVNSGFFIGLAGRKETENRHVQQLNLSDFYNSETLDISM
jgi:hypothetical protein